MDDFDTVAPEALAEGDLIELPELELGTIWRLGERAGYTLGPKGEYFIFDATDVKDPQRTRQLDFRTGDQVRRFPSIPDWLYVASNRLAPQGNTPRQYPPKREHVAERSLGQESKAP
ncbi:hypothetical protein [Mycobacterium sp. E3247]|uniref:hypothetical protein n=1 Tax=Mycobacterium sp. E3247 TaxID=1856864 RepID=UPI00080169CE|nr:hypothetical protein [Mycobacterium sp. E3247]OBH14742.1 hypothetical protein A9X04_13850 [Mycobacterium sp. E3247]